MKGKPARALYRRWNGFDFERTVTLPDVDTRETVLLGECLRIDYASAKYDRKGLVHGYKHSFTKRRGKRPVVLATADGEALLVLFAPRKRFVTARGLTG